MVDLVNIIEGVDGSIDGRTTAVPEATYARYGSVTVRGKEYKQGGWVPNIGEAKARKAADVSPEAADIKAKAEAEVKASKKAPKAKGEDPEALAKSKSEADKLLGKK